MELYKKHRPQEFDELVGNEAVASMLEGFVARDAVPHSILFTGPSGCGKTTSARILRHKIGCSDFDFNEVNAADDNGVEMVRNIASKMMLSPMGGDVRVWLIDECHMLSAPAQAALLKILEDTPAHVYFFLATTDPNKLKKTIITRCTEVGVEALTNRQLLELIDRTAEEEDIRLSQDIYRQIAEAADTSARKALVLLDQVQGADEDEASAIIKKADSKRNAIEIFRVLIRDNARWSDMAPVLRDIKDDPEGLRYLVLACARTTLLKGRNTGRAATIIEAFKDNFYDSKAAGLAFACYEVITAK